MDEKRKEVMIIYGEDLAPTGYEAGELKAGGKHYDRWPAIEQGLIGRVQNNIVIQRLAGR